MYTVRDLIKDEAKSRGMSGEQYLFAGASVADYYHPENPRNFPCILTSVHLLEKDENGNPRYGKPIFHIFWGTDSGMRGRTGYHGTDIKEFKFAYPLEVGNNVMDMEVCRTMEEAQNNGGWIKTPEDREKIKHWGKQEEWFKGYHEKRN